MQADNLEEQIKAHISGKLYSFYTAFKQSGLHAERYSWPQLPYVGREFGFPGRPRILFIGKAPNGWSGDNSVSDHKASHLGYCLSQNITADELSDLSERFIWHRVFPFYGNVPAQSRYNSRFWQVIYLVTTRILHGDPYCPYLREEEESRNCFGTIAWSNVFKVGGTEGGNPDAAFARFQLQNLNTLFDEINVLQPELILFSTGRGYDSFLCQALRVGREGVDSSQRVSAVSGLPSFVQIALRTPHFQAVDTLLLNQISRLVVDERRKEKP